MDAEQAAEQVAGLYRATWRRFHVSRQAVPGADVTPRMLGVLQHLAAAGPLTVGEQAEHLRLSKAAATELVSRLEAKGLVERMRDERDRRKVFVWLTDAGRERAKAHPRVLEDALLLEATARMREADRQALVRGLKALLDASDGRTP